MGKVKVLLVDDHKIVRLGLMTLINDQPDLVVVVEAGTAAEAIRAVGQYRPDVVLMDGRIPREGGIEATYRITQLYSEQSLDGIAGFLKVHLE